MKTTKSLFRIGFQIMLLIGMYVESSAQVLVNGPTCVTPGIAYQYIVKGSWTSEASSQVCITGGMLADSNATCRNGGPLDMVNVIWDSSSIQGTITVNSSVGNGSIQVNISKPLSSGRLDTAGRDQLIPYNNIPGTLYCSGATGGNCTPVFAYQWQESADNMRWTDMAGATSQHLSFSAPITHSRYFRRMVTETLSTTIGYSDQALILIQDEITIYRGKTEALKNALSTTVKATDQLLAGLY